MKSTYINYLRLINNKLIREGILLPVQIKDDMSFSEIEETKTILEGYCYFNDVLSKCDSAYSLQLVSGCKSRLYTDIIKDDVFNEYKEQFDNALSLLCQDTPNPLDAKASLKSLSTYLNKNGRAMSVEDLAVNVEGIAPKTEMQSFQYNDIFAIKQSRELIYEDDTEDIDGDFDYSDDENLNEDGEEEDASSEDEDFDYSDDGEEAEVSEDDAITEELPLDDDEQVFFDFGSEDSSSDEDDEEYNYSDDFTATEESEDDDEEFDYSDDSIGEDDEEEEFDYSDDSMISEDSDSEGEEFDYSGDVPQDGEEDEEDEDFDYSDDVPQGDVEEEEEDFDYSDDGLEQEGIDDDEEDVSYDEDMEDDGFSYGDDMGEEDADDMPVFDLESTTSKPSVVSHKKEDYEVSAEMVMGIVDGGTRLLKGVGTKLKDSLFSKKS